MTEVDQNYLKAKESELTELLREAFKDGHYSNKTYNDSPLNSSEEEWESEKKYYLRRLSEILGINPSQPT